MAANKRNLPGGRVYDVGDIAQLEYNDLAGAEKNMEIGPRLIPLVDDTGIAYTTNATTAKALPSKGKSLAIYNNSASLASVTLGESAAQASLASGVTDASGHVGIPCKPNDWTKISCGESQFVIASSANLLVFLVSDYSEIKQEAAR